MIEIFIKASSARWLKANLINMKRKAINTHYNTIRIQTFTVCTTPLPVKKLGAVQRLKPAKSNIYARPRAGLLFLPCCNTAPYKRLQRVLCHPYKLYRKRNKTARKALQECFRLFAAFYRRICKTDTRRYNTACATLERTHAPGCFAPIPDTSAAPDAVQVSAAALL